MRRLVRPAAALAVLGLAGCATVTTGTTQQILVGSQPPDADCTLTRDGQTLATVRTPAPVTVKRDSKAIHVVCRKDGHEDGKVVMGAMYETASAGNFLLGGVVGVIVDSSSGASNRYQTMVTVVLPPAVGGPATFVAAAPAPADAWHARTVLVAEKSRTGCAADGGAYRLDLQGSTLTVDNANGRMLAATVPPDGAIDEAFRSPTGSQLSIVGNARSRELDVVNAGSGCRWKLVPAS